VSGSRAGGREVVDAVRLVADLLGRFGERLRAGDTIIAGSLTDAIWVGPGDRLTAEISPLGSVALTFIE
jgi:2-keto-4-pentenoate hydratase